jgi:hypothetical protein
MASTGTTGKRAIGDDDDDELELAKGPTKKVLRAHCVIMLLTTTTFDILLKSSLKQQHFGEKEHASRTLVSIGDVSRLVGKR